MTTPNPPTPAHPTSEQAAAVEAERARIKRILLNPGPLLGALIDINESAILMREWMLAVVDDEVAS